MRFAGTRDPAWVRSSRIRLKSAGRPGVVFVGPLSNRTPASRKEAKRSESPRPSITARWPRSGKSKLRHRGPAPVGCGTASGGAVTGWGRNPVSLSAVESSATDFLRMTVRLRPKLLRLIPGVRHDLRPDFAPYRARGHPIPGVQRSIRRAPLNWRNCREKTVTEVTERVVRAARAGSAASEKSALVVRRSRHLLASSFTSFRPPGRQSAFLIGSHPPCLISRGPLPVLSDGRLNCLAPAVRDEGDSRHSTP
jgi:hypothetical protein